MFVPFLPLLIGVTVAGGLLSTASGQALLPAWQLGVVLAALPLLGALVGYLTVDWLGSRSPLRFAPRRVLVVGLWSVIVSSGNLPNELLAQLAQRGLPHATEWALGLLLADLWLADALSLRPPLFPHPREVLALWRVMRFSLPVLFLLAVGTVLSALLEPTGTETLPAWFNGGQNPLLLTLGVYLVLFLLLMPPLVRYAWGLKPLDLSPAAQTIRDELAANGIRGMTLLAWPDMVGHATAGVIGYVPGLRYLLFSQRLAEALTEEEIRSVVAHEAGHIRQRHLFYFLGSLLAFGLLMEPLMDHLMWLSLLAGAPLPLWSLLAVQFMALLLFVRFGLGALSRLFEREADGNAFRRHGLFPFQGALFKVALLNGVAPQVDNWHHFGIAHRVAYLVGAQMRPQLLDRHQARVRRAKALVVLLAGLVLAFRLLSLDAWLSHALESQLDERLAHISQPSPTDQAVLGYLAGQAMRRGDFASTERYFRTLVAWKPTDPEARNNLAWVLITNSRATPTQINEGLSLAQEAAQARPAAFILDTLAEAYQRAGLLAQARQTAQEALRRAAQGDGLGDAPMSYYQNRLAKLSP